MSRLSLRRDLNEPEIVNAAEKLGAFVLKFPPLDLWIWHTSTGWIPVEVKRPHRKGRMHEFTPAQKRFFDFCAANHGPYLVWRTVDDVIRDLGGRVAA